MSKFPPPPPGWAQFIGAAPQPPAGPDARLRCPKCDASWFLWSNPDGSRHLNLRSPASCAYCEPAGVDQLVPEPIKPCTDERMCVPCFTGDGVCESPAPKPHGACTFSKDGKLCECAAGGLSLEERQDCVYWPQHGLCKPGWYCSRGWGHEGPCAAWPVSHDAWDAAREAPLPPPMQDEYVRYGFSGRELAWMVVGLVLAGVVAGALVVGL